MKKALAFLSIIVIFLMLIVYSNSGKKPISKSCNSNVKPIKTEPSLIKNDISSIKTNKPEAPKIKNQTKTQTTKPEPSKSQNEKTKNTSSSNINLHSDFIENTKLDFISKNNPKYIKLNTYDGSGQAVHPDVIYFKNGFHGYKYYMAYTPYPKGNDDYENPCIAVSNDGVNFKNIPGARNPIVPAPKDVNKGGHYSDTDIVFMDGKLVVFYVYNVMGKTGPGKFYKVESTDGIHWSDPELIFTGKEKALSLSPGFVKENKNLKMWYVTNAGKFLYCETCDNCKTWSSPINCKINLGDWKLWHLDVIKDKNIYKALMCTKNINTKVRELFYAESKNGIDWIASKKPILSPSKNGWDNDGIYRSTMAIIDGQYKIWYSAYDKDRNWHISRAIIEPNKNLTKNIKQNRV